MTLWDAEALRVIDHPDGTKTLEWRRWQVSFPTQEQAQKVADDLAFALDTQARVVRIGPE